MAGVKHFDVNELVIQTLGRYLSYVDSSTPGVTYFGLAARGTLASQPAWLLWREITQAGVTLREYADDAQFTQIWDNRRLVFASFFGNSYSTIFDGVNDRIEVPTHPDLEFERTDAFSISMWIKTSQLALQCLMAKGGNTSRGYMLELDASGFLTMRLRNTAANQLAVRNGVNLADGSWHHVGMSYAGNSLPAGIILTVDGVSQVLTTIVNALANPIQDTTNSLNVAATSQATPTNYYDGRIDEVSVWDRALTLAELQEIYNGGAPGDLNSHSRATELIFWHRMGDGDTFPLLLDNAGAVAYDAHLGFMTNMTAADFITDVPT